MKLTLTMNIIMDGHSYIFLTNVIGFVGEWDVSGMANGVLAKLS